VSSCKVGKVQSEDRHPATARPAPIQPRPLPSRQPRAAGPAPGRRRLRIRPAVAATESWKPTSSSQFSDAPASITSTLSSNTPRWPAAATPSRQPQRRRPPYHRPPPRGAGGRPAQGQEHGADRQRRPRWPRAPSLRPEGHSPAPQTVRWNPEAASAWGKPGGPEGFAHLGGQGHHGNSEHQRSELPRPRSGRGGQQGRRHPPPHLRDRRGARGGPRAQQPWGILQPPSLAPDPLAGQPLGRATQKPDARTRWPAGAAGHSTSSRQPCERRALRQSSSVRHRSAQARALPSRPDFTPGLGIGDQRCPRNRTC